MGVIQPAKLVSPCLFHARPFDDVTGSADLALIGRVAQVGESRLQIDAAGAIPGTQLLLAFLGA